MTATLLLNGLAVTAVRLLIPGLGAWTADVDFDLELSPIAPAGPAVLTLGAAGVLLGTIDPDGSGVFGPKGRARVIGGSGGWHKELPAQHFTSDAGVLSTGVLAATAAAVGEKIVEAVPSVLGPHYTRTAGPASRVLDGLEWHVDPLTGITMVGPRLPVQVRPDVVEVLEWDPLEQRATIASGELVQPGSLLVDTRFGSAVVVDVEQVFDSSGARVTAHCRKAALDIAGLLKSLSREAIRPEYQQSHTYRVVLQAADGRLALQATKLLGPVPDMLPITMCMGVPGVTAKLAPGSEVLVEFADGDPSKPLVVGFVASSPPPLEVVYSALRSAFGLGTDPVAKATGVLAAFNGMQAQVTALQAALAAFANPVSNPLIAAAATDGGLALLAAATTGASAGLAAVSSALAVIPSPRTFTD